MDCPSGRGLRLQRVEPQATVPRWNLKGETTMENLDLGYRLLALLADRRDTGIECPLSLWGEQEHEPLEALCQTWGATTLYAHFCLLEEYGLVERPGDAARYGLTARATAFLGEIGERGGWASVKERAVGCPVRPVMREVSRWVLDGCPDP